MTESAAWLARPAVRGWRCSPPAKDARAFHASFAEYRPTPLREVPQLAGELGVRRVFIKDESSRMGLPAFKILGASWAVARLVGRRANLRQPTLEAVRRLAPPDMTLVTATDGNHGRAVAHMARLLGIPARIFVPAVTAPSTIEAIASERAEVVRIEGDYDQAVRRAAVFAREHAGAELVQDTAWSGYQEVPAWIVEGYETLLSETDEQLRAVGATPALVVVPTGVGSLLQAAIAHYRSTASPVRSAILSVEPDSAACVLASLAAGRPTTVETDATVMAGLNCGSISLAAWPFVRDGLDAAIAVDDSDAERAVADLGSLGISAGASGAATLAGARAALTGSDAAARRRALAVDAASAVVLLSTESARP
ncbi:MAG TPA: diaminopropionate ammonia-lyase [Candidatus Limnocylindria bacterium]|nr:diaminopropionate ammonia-lyase [Candidatus Limnocylindria bacterium]